MILIFCAEILILIGEFSTIWKAICVDFQGVRYSFSRFRGGNLIFILVLITIFFYFFVRIKYLIKNQGKILKSFLNIMFFIFLIGVIILPFFSRFTDDGFLFLPLIVVLSIYFSCVKKVFFANIFLLLMIFFSIINQYYVVITGV